MNLPIMFMEDDARPVHVHHKDPLVIEAQIANKRVFRVLVDNGSSANILFKFSFQAIGLTETILSPCPIQLQGFNGEALIPMRKIQVDFPTTYNAILGLSILVDFGAVTSIRHLGIKFPYDNGCVGVARGD
uniref:Uncharacterized protein n=1 Tax=Cannabis sativa TaxID=3483 RepID=A0A803P4H9_CANSA